MRNIFPLQIQRLQGERVLDTLLSQAAHPPGISGEIVLNQPCEWGILVVFSQKNPGLTVYGWIKSRWDCVYAL